MFSVRVTCSTGLEVKDPREGAQGPTGRSLPDVLCRAKVPFPSAKAKGDSNTR